MMRFVRLSVWSCSLVAGAVVSLASASPRFAQPVENPTGDAAVVPAPPIPRAPARTTVIGSRDDRLNEHAKHAAERLPKLPFALKYDPVRQDDVDAVYLMTTRAQTVAAFERTPGKDAAWADLARNAFEYRSRSITHTRLADWRHGVKKASAIMAAKHAIDAGCDDPLILYWRIQDTGGTTDKNPVAWRAAIERLYASPYPPVRRLNGVLNWVVAAVRLDPEQPLRRDVDVWEQRFWELFTIAARERDLVVDEELIEISEHWQLHFLHQGRTRSDALAEFDKRLRAAGASEYLRLTLRGAGLIKRGWEARGNGVGSTVTPDGSRILRESLEEAEELLTEAMRANPDGFTAPTAMLGVCLGLRLPRDEMEDAFARALRANPRNRTACFTKIEYLHPKWYGSRTLRDYWDFGWALAIHPGNVDLALGGIESITGNRPVHGPRYEATKKAAEQFYAIEPIWKITQLSFERLLDDNPGNTGARNHYARLATVAGQKEIASSQYGIIGEAFQRPYFTTKAEYDEFRRRAGVSVP